MSQELWTFLYGCVVLALLGWYIFADNERNKRIVGTILTVLLVAFCVQSVIPPIDQKDPKTGAVTVPGRIHLGIDLQGGTSFLIRLVAPQVEEPANGAAPKTAEENGAAAKAPAEAVPVTKVSKEITPRMIEQAMEAIRHRVDKLGVSEPIITPQGSDRILVQIPGLDTEKIDFARKQLQQVAKLEFRLVHPQSQQLLQGILAGRAVIPPGYEIKDMKMTRGGKEISEKLLVNKRTDLEGSHVTRAGAGFGQDGWEVSLTFDSVGAEQFGKLTEQVYNEHSQMAILLDGAVQSAPGVTHGAIWGGSAQISGGNMDQKEANNLASALENPLQTPVQLMEERSASPTLGKDAIKSGIWAGVGGLAAVLVFVVLYYRFAGFVAMVGLVINIVVLFGAMSMFGFVLTLPGIAGVILTIGLAVDANVLIYERLREEMAAGKSLALAIDSAYDKAFTVIFDANATTLITAAILFWRATGPVKGFAVTLTVGVIASVFSAMVATRMLFSWALSLNLIRRISMLHIIPTGKNINFMGKRVLWITISLAVILVSVGGFAVRYPANLGIDFRGGDMVMFSTEKPVSEGEVREALAPLNLDLIVQKERSIGAVTHEYITVKSPDNTSDKVEARLKEAMPDAGFKEHQKDHVGKIVGSELAMGSLVALVLGMLGILIYVTIRFELSFAIGALVALLHDVLITIGVFSLAGRELSLVMIGAILTIAGYSINDTIVVYDRIREGLKSGRKGSIQDIMNASINETLSRTLLTSGCTFLSVASLFFFGGPVLRDFAFSMLIGIVVGTYSSIFIAAPIVLWWSGHKGKSLRSEVIRPEAPPLTA